MTMMKARLEEKVGKLRSQVISFANDGMQVSLNIPDTSDVKDTFGSVINTVAEQQDEIHDLHTDIEATGEESAIAQRKLLAWTASCVQKLKEENERLQSKLLDANKQIKNLSYNMQGFVDQAAAEEAEAVPEPLEFDDVPALPQKYGKKSEPETSSLFPTEEGAELGQEGMGFAPEIRKFARYKSAEQREQEKEKYRKIPPNTLPNNVRARWRWAIRKVMSDQRRKRQKVGLTRARMDPKQTFAGRLDRVEALMLNMNGNMSEQLSAIDKRINHKIDTAVTRIDREVSTAAGKLHMLTEDCSARFKALQEEVGQVDQTMREFFAKVQQQASGDTKQLRETLRAVEQHLKDVVHLDLDLLRSGVSHIATELDQMEGSADKLLQRVESLHTLSSTLPQYDPAKPIEASMSDLTDLLQTDTHFREARHDLVRLQTGLSGVLRLFHNVQHQVNSASQHFSKESVQTAVIELMNPSQVEDLNDLSQRCVGADGHIKHIDAILVNLDRMCVEHDKVLKDRLRVFVGLSHQVRDLGSATAQISSTQVAHRSSAGSPAPAAPVVAVGGGLTTEQVKLLARFDHDINDLNLRVGVIEGMNALDEALGFEEEAEEEQPYVWKPPPVVPQGSIIQEKVVSEKSYRQTTFASLEAPPGDAAKTTFVHVEAPSPTPGTVDAAATEIAAAPFGFSAQPAQAAPGAAPSAAPAPSGSALSAAAGHAVAQSASPHQPAGAFSPATTPGHYPPTRKGSAMTSGSEKRKASAVASLEMLEARLRPLIEKIVAANVEEKIAVLEANMASNDFDEEDDYTEGGDEFPAPALAEEPPAGAAGTGEGEAAAAAAATAAEGNANGEQAPAGAGADANRVSSPSSDGPPSPVRVPPPIRSRQSSRVEFGGARIRREASRFGMGGDSGKMRGGSSKSGRSGKGGVDITPYVQDLVLLKKENSKLVRQVGKLEEGKLTADDIERMFHHMYNQHHHTDQKEESNHAMHVLEKRVDTLTKEITALHAAHTKAIATLQADFTDTLYKVVNSAAQSLDAENKESFVSTRALCLGCGRTSMVRSHPENRPTSPSFFPQINQHSTDGPDVLRGGFKLPVKNPLNPTYVLEASSPSPGATKARTVKSAGQRMQEALAASSLDGSLGTSSLVGNSLDAILPRVKTAQPRPHTSHHTRTTAPGGGVDIEEDDDLEEEFVPTEGSMMNITGGALEEPSRVTLADNGSVIIQANKGFQLNIASTTAPLRATSAVKVVRSARPEAEEVRPVYKKGFPAKKSMRAETAYAHERYELDQPNNILLQSNRIANNGALVPGTEGIMRPYSSQEASRPRIAQGTAVKMSATTMNTSTSSTRF